MNVNEAQELRELTPGELRDTSGGVLPGGCVDPNIQQMIDIVNGTQQP